MYEDECLCVRIVYVCMCVYVGCVQYVFVFICMYCVCNVVYSITIYISLSTVVLNSRDW